MREISSKVKYLYLLSGKPAPNNITEYFSQMKVVDPETFPMSYGIFLNSFCYQENGKYCMSEDNEKLFADMVAVKSLIISKKDCLDLPETIDSVRLIELPSAIMNDYNDLYRECMAIIKGMDDSEIYYSTPSRLAILMKLRQMASGFFMTGDEGHRQSKVIIDIHNAKLRELNDVIDQIEGEQVIIWCQFQHEIEIVEKELSKRAYTVTAYGGTKDLEKNIEDFKTGKAQYIVAHPKTLKYGVTFVNCKYTVYYSFSYSAEDYDQSHDRNYRLGQTEVCTYIYLQAEDTIDEIMYKKVMNKLSDAEFFEQLIKDAAKHGIDYSELKGKSNDEIKAALRQENCEITNIAKKLVERKEEAEKTCPVRRSKYYTTLEYLNKITEPTDEELKWLEKNYIGKPAALFYDDEPLSGILYDFSRNDYFDFVHPDERVVKFTRNITDADFEIFIRDVPVSERWVYRMYRDVYEALTKIDKKHADLIVEKYGLEDGRKKTNWAVSQKFRSRYGWGERQIAYELSKAREELKEQGNLRDYIEYIRRAVC